MDIAGRLIATPLGAGGGVTACAPGLTSCAGPEVRVPAGSAPSAEAGCSAAAAHRAANGSRERERRAVLDVMRPPLAPARHAPAGGGWAVSAILGQPARPRGILFYTRSGTGSRGAARAGARAAPLP